jgi:uncharacterized protein (TIGR02172 family)
MNVAAEWAKGPRIAQGRTAEVFQWGDAQVLKLYRAGYPDAWVAHEAKVGRLMHEAGLDTPAVGDVLEIDGRRGIVFERLDGPSMLDVLVQQPQRLPELAAEFARLHAAMHATQCPELPSLREWTKQTIGQTARLTDEVKARACRAVDALPDGGAVCHSDFHPANIVMTARGPIVIDWIGATRGHPTADVAHTVLLFRHFGLPPGLSSAERERLLALRRHFLDAYLAAYARLRVFSTEEVEAWIAPLAASMLFTRLPKEEEDVMIALAEGIR